MNKIKSIILAFSLVFSAFALLYGCSGENADQNSGNSELTAEMAYVCPMRCEGSGSDKAGKCSVCGMDLVKSYVGGANEAHEHGEAGHSEGSHDEAESHDHSEGSHDEGESHDEDGSHDQAESHDHSEHGHDHGEEGHQH